MSAVLALVAAGVYGAADFCGGLAARRGPLLVMSAVALWVGGAGLLLAAAAFGAAAVTLADLAWGALAGFGTLSVTVLLYGALARGTMGVVAPMTALTAILVPVLVDVLRGRAPEPSVIAGVVLALVAITLVSQERSRRGGPVVVIMALAAGLGISLFYVSIEQAAPDAGLWPLVAARVSASLVQTVWIAPTLWRLLRDPSAIAALRPGVPLAALSGIGDSLANALYLLALQAGGLTLAATLTSLYPAATVLLAAIVLRERLVRLQYVGLAVAVPAALLVGAG